MEFSELLEWVMDEKNLSIHSVKDVISPCGMACRMPHTKSICSDTLENLQNNDKFEESSMFIKRQLKRAEVLYNEFKKNINEGLVYERPTYSRKYVCWHWWNLFSV